MVYTPPEQKKEYNDFKSNFKNFENDPYVQMAKVITGHLRYVKKQLREGKITEEDAIKRFKELYVDVTRD